MNGNWPNLLDGKSVVVCGGGGGGIGTAVAKVLARAGASTTVADIDPSRAESVAREIRDEGFEAFGSEVNVLDSGSVDSLIEDAAGKYDKVDALVNVVGGMNAFLAWLETSEVGDADFDFMVNLNLRSAFFTCRSAIRRFAKQGTGGVIVNTSSISGLQAAPRHAAYGAAKAGVMSLTRTLAVEYGPSGVRVNAVAPGSIATTPAAPGALVAAMGDQTHKRADIGVVPKLTQGGGTDRIPAGRVGQPVDIAGAVLFLTSDLSAYVSGQTIMVDGGASVNWDLS